MRFELESLATISTGNTTVRKPPERGAKRWFVLAEEDDNVTDALEHFAQSDDWFNLDKSLELLQAALRGPYEECYAGKSEPARRQNNRAIHAGQCAATADGVFYRQTGPDSSVAARCVRHVGSS